MAQPVKEYTKNPNDPRRDRSIFYYNKEVLTPKEGEGSGGTAELYQLISLMIGIFAFLMKVSLSIH
jgi:hypothetical protein